MILDRDLFDLLEHTADAMFTVSDLGEICSWNRSAEKLLQIGASSRRRRRDTNKKAERARRPIGYMNLLAVVDGSEPSDRVLKYLATLLAGRFDVQLHLAYIASALPASLLEHGGAEGAKEERRLETELRTQQRRWMRSADKKPNNILIAARDTLLRGGVRRSVIHIGLSSPLDAREPVEEILILAQERRCQTLVIGHHAHGWLSGPVRGHLAEQLIRRAEGVAVWVID